MASGINQLLTIEYPEIIIFDDSLAGRCKTLEGEDSGPRA
jgi:hypothetical protein